MPEFDTDEMYDALNLTEWERDEHYYEALFDYLAEAE
jgi:hypothetical protein